MTMKRLLAVVCLASAACGGSSPAPAPTPLPAATITPSGQGAWVNCSTVLSRCDFQGEARNTGTGCATAVRGVIRFYDGGQQQLGSSDSWALPAAQIVRRNEAFSYLVFSVGPSIYTASSSYVSESAWTNVACP